MGISLEELLRQIEKQPDAIEKLFIEAKKLPQLEDVIRALAIFARSLTPKGKFYKEGERFVLYPNFVAFTPRHKRKKQVSISLRGNVKEFENQSVLPLKNGRAGSYSECVLNNPKQLAAAAAYIQHAYELYQEGSSRTRKAVIKTKVPISEKRV